MKFTVRGETTNTGGEGAEIMMVADAVFVVSSTLVADTVYVPAVLGAV